MTWKLGVATSGRKILRRCWWVWEFLIAQSLPSYVGYDCAMQNAHSATSLTRSVMRTVHVLNTGKQGHEDSHNIVMIYELSEMDRWLWASSNSWRMREYSCFVLSVNSVKPLFYLAECCPLNAIFQPLALRLHSLHPDTTSIHLSILNFFFCVQFCVCVCVCVCVWWRTL